MMQQPSMVTNNNAWLVFFIGLIALSIGALGRFDWQGSFQLHTLMEVTSTILAAVVGAIALIRYYCKKETFFLLIGVGFIGTAFLDGYHGFVTSEFFSAHMPSALPSLSPWSWTA